MCQKRRRIERESWIGKEGKQTNQIIRRSYQVVQIEYCTIWEKLMLKG